MTDVDRGISLSCQELFRRSCSKNVEKLVCQFVRDFDIEEHEVKLNGWLNGCLF